MSNLLPIIAVQWRRSTDAGAWIAVRVEKRGTPRGGLQGVTGGMSDVFRVLRLVQPGRWLWSTLNGREGGSSLRAAHNSTLGGEPQQEL